MTDTPDDEDNIPEPNREMDVDEELRTNAIEAAQVGGYEIMKEHVYQLLRCGGYDSSDEEVKKIADRWHNFMKLRAFAALFLSDSDADKEANLTRTNMLFQLNGMAYKLVPHDYGRTP